MRIWMYWPDEMACQFKENVEKGFMACGLPNNYEVGDLTQILQSRDGLEGALEKAYGEGRRTAGGEKLLREFAMVMAVGDYVLARKDFDQIVGIGIIASDYYYDASRSRFRHCRKVDWICTSPMPFPEGLKRSGKWHRVTMIDMPYRQIAEQIISSINGSEDIGSDYDSSNIQMPQPTTRLQDKRHSSDNQNHASFIRKARQYQESVVKQWAKELGEECIWDERPNHGVWLKDEFALQGLVFYEGFRREIMELYRSGRTKIGMNLLINALRSEHIPYNLFFPMMMGRNKEAARGFFNELLGTDALLEVIDVWIEYAPQPKANYLNDGTSFDAFVLYRHKEGVKGGIGIEVKYTEREYQIGETEYKNTHDGQGRVRLSAHYARATAISHYYRHDSESTLVSDNLRQIWRNHILGASMVQHGDISHFASVTVFPNANPHFHTVIEEYRALLTEEGKGTFYAFTYEKMFEALAHYFNNEEQLRWIRYLYKRYLFGAEMPKQKSSANNNRFFTKSPFRGVSAELIESFKRSSVYELYLRHQDELLIGIRCNYLNVYYRMNNIAEVRLMDNHHISCAIHPYFLRKEGKYNELLTGKYIDKLITERYEDIKWLVENKKNVTLEKVIQQMLVMKNNANPDSKWFCVDVEWARLFTSQAEKDACISSRMDIIAISKDAPHRVAIIELKYGSKSIGGSAGVLKHIEDFLTLKEGSKYMDTRIDYYDGICTDICNIIEAYVALGVQLPETLKHISKDSFAPTPEFYVLTMDNNAANRSASTPKQTMAAYLFSPTSKNFLAWGCKMPAKENVQDKLGIDVLDSTSQLPVTFIFSTQNVNTLQVHDILEDSSHEIIRPTSSPSSNSFLRWLHWFFH